MYCWPDDFAQSIYHIGNANEMHCTIKSGLKSDTIWTNPESKCTNIHGNLTTIQYIGAIWSSLRENVCSFIKLDHMQSFFSHTQLTIYIEKVVCMKTGEELYCRVPQSPRLPRVVLTPNLQHGRRHQSEERLYRETCHSLLEDTRREHPGESRRYQYRDTCCGNIDCRIPGIPHSTIQQVDTNRKETVDSTTCCCKTSTKLRRPIHSVKSRRTWSPIWQYGDLQALRDFFEETMPELCLMLGSWHRMMHMWKMPAASRKESTDEQRKIRYERFGVLPIPGSVIKKNPSHGARHGTSMRQTMYFKAHDMLRKARNKNMALIKIILERWYRDEQHRKSLSCIGWTEEQIKLCDALALEDLPAWLHLKNEVDTRIPGTFLWTERGFKDQSSNALIFVKRSRNA